MTEAIAQGRKIYDNLKKAIRYIVSIHIPIILIVTIPFITFMEIHQHLYPDTCYIFRIDNGTYLFYYL